MCTGKASAEKKMWYTPPRPQEKPQVFSIVYRIYSEQKEEQG